MEIWPGSAYPLGATFDGTGTNFALFSEAAERVELCLFDDDGSEVRIEMIDVDAYVWHCYLPPGPARPAVRLSGARSGRPGAGCEVQSGQGAARPVREGDDRTRSTGIRRCSATSSTTRRASTTTTRPAT